jgi:hypothetical protein
VKISKKINFLRYQFFFEFSANVFVDKKDENDTLCCNVGIINIIYYIY